YEHGEGVEQSTKDAFKWYKKAADQEYAKAQHTLGWWYMKGEGVDKSPSKAIFYLKKAADQGKVKHLKDFVAFCMDCAKKSTKSIPDDSTEEVKKEELRLLAKTELEQICKKLYNEAQKDSSLNKKTADEYFKAGCDAGGKAGRMMKNVGIDKNRQHYEAIYNYMRSDILGNADAGEKLKTFYFFTPPNAEK
ncbi:MAG: tetratricopeptide repeat protein, partial [Bacillota bacterium]